MKVKLNNVNCFNVYNTILPIRSGTLILRRFVVLSALFSQAIEIFTVDTESLINYHKNNADIRRNPNSFYQALS